MEQGHQTVLTAMGQCCNQIQEQNVRVEAIERQEATRVPSAPEAQRKEIGRVSQQVAYLLREITAMKE